MNKANLNSNNGKQTPVKGLLPHSFLPGLGLLLWLLLFVTPGARTQFSAGVDDTINPGVPVTLHASYGLLANEVTLTDDGVEGPFPIGFPFTFYDEVYTEFYIGANGWISFSGLDQNCNIRDAFRVPGTSVQTFMPKICILGPFQNFNPVVAGGPYVFYRTIGNAPDRKLVVMWCQVPMNWCELKTATFQIVLNEPGTQPLSTIESHLMVKPECFEHDSNRATMGIQNAYKVLGISVPGRNATSWSVPQGSPEGWRYSPVNQDVYDVTPIPFRFQPITPGNKISYRWYLGDEFLSDQQELVVAPGETTTYIAKCTLCNGQEFTDSVTIYVIPWIPNAFTPNGDGLNDEFRILGLPPENITYFNFQVYNRWGQMVFTSTDILQGWDGKLKGEYCPEGYYTWVIFYEDRKKTKTTNKGSVMLLR
jgi:gliding motility-associated-like protein